MISPTYGFQFKTLTELNFIYFFLSLGTGQCGLFDNFGCELSAGADMREFVALGEASLNR